MSFKRDWIDSVVEDRQWHHCSIRVVVVVRGQSFTSVFETETNPLGSVHLCLATKLATKFYI